MNFFRLFSGLWQKSLLLGYLWMDSSETFTEGTLGQGLQNIADIFFNFFLNFIFFMNFFLTFWDFNKNRYSSVNYWWILLKLLLKVHWPNSNKMLEVEFWNFHLKNFGEFLKNGRKWLFFSGTFAALWDFCNRSNSFV